jgi:exodeoxyribonuclease VII small subunit
MMQETAPLSFEAALARLEEIAALLDHNDVPLADALALCAEAATLTRACRELLAQAEGKLEQLVESDGKATLAPLDE